MNKWAHQVKCFLGLGSDFSAHQGMLTDHPHTAERLDDYAVLVFGQQSSLCSVVWCQRGFESRKPSSLGGCWQHSYGNCTLLQFPTGLNETLLRPLLPISLHHLPLFLCLKRSLLRCWLESGPYLHWVHIVLAVYLDPSAPPSSFGFSFRSSSLREAAVQTYAVEYCKACAQLSCIPA